MIFAVAILVVCSVLPINAVCPPEVTVQERLDRLESVVDTLTTTHSKPIQQILLPITDKYYKLPFVDSIIGHSVEVIGKPIGNTFAINLEASDKTTINFHLNPRMQEPGMIIRNTFNNGWSTEETHLDIPFPLKMNVPFSMKITAKRDRFVVYINGIEVFEYKKHLDMCLIRYVRLTAGVKGEKILFR